MIDPEFDAFALKTWRDLQATGLEPGAVVVLFAREMRRRRSANPIAWRYRWKDSPPGYGPSEWQYIDTDPAGFDNPGIEFEALYP